MSLFDACVIGLFPGPMAVGVGSTKRDDGRTLYPPGGRAGLGEYGAACNDEDRCQNQGQLFDFHFCISTAVFGPMCFRATLDKGRMSPSRVCNRAGEFYRRRFLCRWAANSSETSLVRCCLLAIEGSPKNEFYSDFIELVGAKRAKDYG